MTFRKHSFGRSWPGGLVGEADGVSQETGMTEQEWREQENPKQLLEFLGKKRAISDRKWFLFAACCCRRIWPLLTDPRCRRAVELLEQGLDGGGGMREARRLAEEALHESEGYGKFAPWEALRKGEARTRVGAAAISAARAVAVTVAPVGVNGDQKTFEAERRHQCDLLRDVFGNPFRPLPALDPAWLVWQEGTVPRLARAAYENRDLPSGSLDNSLLSILADALEEAGCSNAEILEHLRSPGPHARGCFVLDAIMARA
jgi:hypothetical protein